jgi:hypothetical protein
MRRSWSDVVGNANDWNSLFTRSSVIVVGNSQKDKTSAFNSVGRWVFEAMFVKVMKEKDEEAFDFLSVRFGKRPTPRLP